MTAGFIGIDSKLAEDYEDEEALENVESVTYEVVKLYADKATLDGDAWHVTVSNLNAYSYLIKHDLGLGQESNEVVRVETGNGNEEITIHYSLRRDIPREVRGFAGSTDGDALVSFRIPTDGVANTKFWLVVNDDLKGGERGFPLVGAADGVVVLDSAWFEARNITLRSGDNTVKVALGNDKYGCPDKLSADDWSAVATFSVNAAAVRTGKLAVKVGHPTASGLTNLTVAVYEKADLAEPVAFMSGCDAGETVVISNLRANAEYFVAAWNVKNPADGRDATMKYRMPYDTWGYFTKLGEGANGFDAKAVKAELAPSVTNAIFLQDTDWNDNGVIDRDEDFKSVAGETKPVAPGAGDAITDIDMDGVGDSEDDDFIVDNGDEVLENDVMAYATKEFFCVKIGTNEQSAAWYAITDLAKETTTNKLTGGKVTIPRGTLAEELKSLRSTYTYGTKRSAPTGLGTNVTFAAAADGVTNIVYDIAYKTLVLVHAQVYDEFGFNPNTANASIAPTEWVNTKGFTKSDKTAVAYYLAGIGAIPAATTNWVLSTKRIDFDYDGIDDGFELYVMFGTNGYQAATMTHSPWIYADRNADVDEDGLDLLHEYDKGQEPTDPWSVDTDRDGVIDFYAYQYHLKGQDAGGDFDDDGLSNYAEYLISEVFRYAKLDPENPKTDGYCVDYFRKMGELYFGEIFTDHDQIDDLWEAEHANIANRYVYDPSRDDQDDGWSNWSEYNAYAWGYGFYPDIIDTFINGDIDSQLRCFPQPVIDLRVSYNGRIDGSWKSLIVRTWTANSKQADATFQVDSMKKASSGGGKDSGGNNDEGVSSSVGGMEKTQVLGVYTGNPILRGYLNPGLIVLSSAKFEMTHVSQELMYKWHCTECERGAGPYEDYKADINEHGEAKTDPNGRGVSLDEVKPSAGWETFAQTAGGEIDGRHGQIYSVSNNVQVGEIDYRTGEYVLDLAALSKACGYDFTGKAFKSSFAYALGAYWPQTVWLSSPEQGYVKEGKNTIEAFFDLNENGLYDVGEPYGVARDVDVSWHHGSAEIELTDMSAITPRVDLWLGHSDREAITEEQEQIYSEMDDRGMSRQPNSVSGFNLNPVTLEEDSDSARIRIVRYAVDGFFTYSVGVPNRTVLDTYFHKNGRYGILEYLDGQDDLLEGSFLGNGAFDIDWAYLKSEVCDHLSVQNYGITNMTYLIVVGDGPAGFSRYYQTNASDRVSVLMSDEGSHPIFVTRRFERNWSKPKAIGLAEGGILHGSRPTFVWSMPDEEAYAKRFGTSYTAFRIQLANKTTGDLIWVSDVMRAPVQDKAGRFSWTAPLYAGDQTPLGQVFEKAGDYQWCVAMYNAKFKPDDDFNDQWSEPIDFSVSVDTQQETDDSGFSSIDVSVKYTGPAEVLAKCENVATTEGKVRIQAFTSPDFSGDPAAQGFVTNKLALTDATDIRANGRLIGLPFGTYYIRAYIDSNGNFKKDPWESWGAVKGAVEVKLNQLAPIVGLYIEDADTDSDWIPDAYEYLHPDKYEIGRSDASVDPEGRIILKKEIYDGIVGDTAGISRFLSGATLKLFENFEAAGLLLGITGTTEASTIDAIRKAVEKNIDPNTVKITSLVVDAGNGTNGKVILTIGAKATDSIAGYLFSPIYEIPTSTTVKIKVYRKENLATANWGDPVKTETVTIDGSTMTERIEVPLAGVDFNSGFYKVEIVQ